VAQFQNCLRAAEVRALSYLAADADICNVLEVTPEYVVGIRAGTAP
jgi:hypothetical protein